MSKRFTLALVAGLAAMSLHAEQTCFAPPPPHECKQPEDLGVQPSDREIKAYNKNLKEYQACMQSYIKARQADAQAIQAVYNQALDANNSAIKEFNAWIAKMKDVEKEREGK